MFRPARAFLLSGAGLLCLAVAQPAEAFVPIATANQVTNTKNGRNESPAVDTAGRVVVFVSNSDHVAGVLNAPGGAFDHDGSGNAFTSAGATHPDPVCTNCTSVDDSSGNLYIWRAKKKQSDPANSMRQLTFSSTGGFDANRFPDVDSKGQWLAWDSDRDQTGGNADENREIFLMEIDSGTITQVTSTTGGGGSANQRASISDRGSVVAFTSTRDFAAVATCKRPDGTTACGNGDNNSEVMLYDRAAGTLTQVTSTTGDGASANTLAHVSSDGAFVAFQSVASFGGALTGGVTCSKMGGGACANDGNSEILLYDLELRTLTQITDTIAQSGCNGAGSSEWAEASKKAKYLVFESTCEDQLNPTGCGACDNNDEIFLVDLKKAEIAQLTISDAGWNRVPRLSATGSTIAFESNRDYMNLNNSHNETLFILKRSSTKAVAGLTNRSQVEEDDDLELAGTTQNPKTQLTTIQFNGGFPAQERIAVSGNGRFVAFESSKNVGNHEIWLVDKNKCTHGLPDCQ
ncbi:MAG: hypothetical protein FJ144_04315 [Deltaproteobacteria bacterium]|nr:hypothetical protein [Deltaproteobacteria bacterium]